MIWFLAYRMGLSTAPAATADLHADYMPPPLPAGSALADWRNWFWALVAGLALLTAAHWIFT